MISEKDRRDESRRILVNAFEMALGSYTEQEAKKFDQWRDQPTWKLFNHLAHELEEIRKNMKEKMPNTYLIHNGMDVCSLSTIFLAHLMLKDDLIPLENKK